MRLTKSILAVVVGVTGWWLLFDAGWRVGLGALLLVLCAGLVMERNRSQ